jgi:hypothetical protein
LAALLSAVLKYWRDLAEMRKKDPTPQRDDSTAERDATLVFSHRVRTPPIYNERSPIVSVDSALSTISLEAPFKLRTNTLSTISLEAPFKLRTNTLASYVEPGD